MARQAAMSVRSLMGRVRYCSPFYFFGTPPTHTHTHTQTWFVSTTSGTSIKMIVLMLENSTQTESLIVDSEAGTRRRRRRRRRSGRGWEAITTRRVDSVAQSVSFAQFASLSLSLPQSFIHSFIIVEAATITALNVLKITHLHVLV